MNIILAILMLGVLIFVHEFGHFIVAKANGVAVVEFSIGFGPKLFKFKKKETEYCLKLIPFGGACMMLGDDMLAEPGSREELSEDSEDTEDVEAIEEDSDGHKTVSEDKAYTLKQEYDMSKAFANKSIWSRIAIIAAGPLFNFILAFIFAIVIIGCVGTDPCIVDVVNDASPAAKAGLLVGDEIVKINSNGISFAKEFSFHQSYHADEVMNITYKRDGKKYKTTVTPELKNVKAYRVGITVTNYTTINSVSENTPASRAGLKPGDTIVLANGITVDENNTLSDIIGITKDAQAEVVIRRNGNEQTVLITPELVEYQEYYTGFDCYGIRQKVSPAQTIVAAFKEVGYWIETVIKSIGMMFTGEIGINALSGPVGVVDAVNTVVEQSKPDGAFYVMLNILNFMVMISANLGVMNLLPIPALDGGRLLFMLIGLVRGKPVKKEREGMVHFVGMVLLMLLMVYVLFKDIVGLF